MPHVLVPREQDVNSAPVKRPAPIAPTATRYASPVATSHVPDSGALDSLTQSYSEGCSAPVQAGAQQQSDSATLSGVSALANGGVAGAGDRYPHRQQIQAAFGRHDLGNARAQIGGAALPANLQMGSLAYTTGDRVGFRDFPSLHTAAHEAAHIIQQRAGVQLKDGVGRSGDRYEAHADRVADVVQRGESAQPVLDEFVPGHSMGSVAPRGVQHQNGDDGPSDLMSRAAAVTNKEDATAIGKEICTEYYQSASIGQVMVNKVPEQFLDAAQEGCAEVVSAKTDDISYADVESLTSKSEVYKLVYDWAEPLDYWSRYLSARWPSLEATISETLTKMIYETDAKPSKHSKFEPTQHIRDGIFDAVASSFGVDFVARAYANNPKIQNAETDGERRDAIGNAADLFAADHAQYQKNQTAEERELPFDQTRVTNLAGSLITTWQQAHSAAQQFDLRISGGEQRDVVLAEFSEVVSAYDQTVMTYKSALKLGTGQATQAQADLLTFHAGELRRITDTLNQKRVDTEAQKLNDGTMGSTKKQQREELSTATGWDPLAITGMSVDKRPECRTWSKVEARTSGEVDQMVTHEGSRSTKQTLSNFESEGASSHFTVNPDGTIAQLGPVSATMGHAGDAGERSVGVDLTFYDGQKYNEVKKQGHHAAAYDDYMDFYEQSPAQIVAMAKLGIAVEGLSGNMPMNPQVDKFGEKTPDVLNEMGPGLYTHASAKDNTHSDPGDRITQEMFKWGPAVKLWEAKFGPVNVNDEAELERLRVTIASAEQTVVAERKLANLVPEEQLAPTSGKIIKIGGGNYDAEPDSHTLIIQDAAGVEHSHSFAYSGAHGIVQLGVSIGDSVSVGQPLVKVNPYDPVQYDAYIIALEKAIAGAGH